MIRWLTIAILMTTNVMAVNEHKHKKHKPVIEHHIFAPSDEALLKQNQEIERLGLDRMYDDEDLHEAILASELVPIPKTYGISIAKSLPENRRYCRPWTAQFLHDIGQLYYNKYKQNLFIDSAVRTVKVQSWLRRIMGNRAAPAEGDLASSHEAGTTIDISLGHLTIDQRLFIEAILSYLSDNSFIIVEEERRNRCFHIMVMRSYHKDIL